MELCSLDTFISRTKEAGHRFPISMSAELTYRCNFTCQHCFCRLPVSHRNKERELSYNDWDRLLGESADEGVLFLLLTGGEPLLRDDFQKIWKMAKKRGFILELFTNGSLITPETADFLAEWTPKTVSISLYGSTESTYREMTGCSGMLQTVLDNMQLLLDRGITTHAKTIFTRHSIHEHNKLKELVCQYGGIFRWDAEMVGSYPEGGATPLAQRLSPREIVNLEKNHQERADIWEKHLKKAIPSPPRTQSPFRCAIGRSHFHINPYGKMQPCLLLANITYELQTGSIKEGWHTALPKKLKELPWTLGKCQTCNLADACRICPAKANLEGDPLSGPTTFHCLLAQERMKTFRPDYELELAQTLT